MTFTIPAAQWLSIQFLNSSSYRVLTGTLLVILCARLWYAGYGNSPFLPESHAWKTFAYLVGMVVIVLLAFNSWNRPVAKITGQARTPLEVVEVILLVPAAEELIFRGILWSNVQRVSRAGGMIALIVTSLLFGVEHLGYWAQAGLPLPLDAYLHALSMVGAGVCFGWLRWGSRSLAVPIAIHMLANGVILLAQ